jgi:peroxiredoxin Q/BCP
MLIEIGKKAPAFRLKNQDGETVKLSDFKSRRVLLFAYPKAATPGCTKQACGLRGEFETFESADAVVLGLSPDTPDKLKAWKDKESLPYDLLSDPDHTVLDKYGAWGEKSMYGRKY